MTDTLFEYRATKSQYELWCNYIAMKDEKDPKSFKAFLKTEIGQRHDHFWSKKYFAEHYFGLKYKYDQENAKWCIDNN